MSVVSGVLMEELERQKANEKSYRELLEKLPKGSLYQRKLHGRSYIYRVLRDGKKVASIYVGPAGSPAATQAWEDQKEYRRIRDNIKRCQQEQVRLAKALKPYEK